MEKLRIILRGDSTSPALLFVDINKPDKILDSFLLSEELNEKLKNNAMTENDVTPALRAFYDKCGVAIAESLKNQTYVLKDEDVVIAEGGTDVRQLSEKAYRQVEYTALSNILSCMEAQKLLAEKNNETMEKIANQLYIDVKNLKTAYLENVSVMTLPNLDLGGLSDRQIKQKGFELIASMLETSVVNANNYKYGSTLLALLLEVFGVDLKPKGGGNGRRKGNSAIDK